MILGPTLELERAMAKAQTYAQWHEAALAHDKHTGLDRWREADESGHFDYHSIRRRLVRLRELRKAGDDKGLYFTLNEGIHGNMDGMGSERLYFKAKSGTKKVVESYITEIADALDHLANTDVDGIDDLEKSAFFARASQCYGQSALMFSGSGNFLYFHVGVARALMSEGLLPHIISGSSGGSLVGAILCTHTDEQLATMLDHRWFSERFADQPDDPKGKAGGKGSRLRDEQIRAYIEMLLPDLTFQEAYDLTGRHLNVSVAPALRHQNSRLLNAIASPNVLVRDAVMASCALPGLVEAVTLMARDASGQRVPYLSDRQWIDGTMAQDLPAKRLARLYGVNHYIVSQANPLISYMVSNMKTRSGPLEVLADAGVATMRAWFNANMILLSRPLSLFPTIENAAAVTMSVINQSFSGDINLVRPPRIMSINKILGHLSAAEMEDLVHLGEHTTWQRIEMIRIQTLISRRLAAILA